MHCNLWSKDKAWEEWDNNISRWKNVCLLFQIEKFSRIPIAQMFFNVCRRCIPEFKSAAGCFHFRYLPVPREAGWTNQEAAFTNVIRLRQSRRRILGWNGPRANLDGCLPPARAACNPRPQRSDDQWQLGQLPYYSREFFFADVCSYALCTSCTVNDGCVILKIWEYISRVVW